MSRCSRATSLFDHLIGAGDERRRYFKAKCFGGLQIDHQLELRRLLHGEVCGSRTLEDSINIDCCATVLVGDIG